ncbi:MAG: TIGR03936 family radical SAM-associated protein [Turicibacter sp.]|nr:TIGR03936 family radical SAM-associated protein [Turicibacter sp.]
MRYWIKFAKTGKMIYIGHLDLVKVLQAAIRRADLPVVYSEGFNPHQKMSFALPLSLGMASVCEYMELHFQGLADVFALNSHLPNGLEILASYEIPEKTPKLASLLRAADYSCVFKTPPLYDKLEELKMAKEFKIMKKSKSGVNLVDVKPDIFHISYKENNLILRLSAGSKNNLNPNTLLEKLLPASENPKITRQNMYTASPDNKNLQNIEATLTSKK